MKAESSSGHFQPKKVNQSTAPFFRDSSLLAIRLNTVRTTLPADVRIFVISHFPTSPQGTHPYHIPSLPADARIFVISKIPTLPQGAHPYYIPWYITRTFAMPGNMQHEDLGLLLKMKHTDLDLDLCKTCSMQTTCTKHLCTQPKPRALTSPVALHLGQGNGLSMRYLTPWHSRQVFHFSPNSDAYPPCGVSVSIDQTNKKAHRKSERCTTHRTEKVLSSTSRIFSTERANGAQHTQQIRSDPQFTI